MKRMLFFLAVILLPNFLKAQGPVFTRFFNFGARIFVTDIARKGDSSFYIMGENYGSYNDPSRYGNYFCTVGESGFSPTFKSYSGDSMLVNRMNSKMNITGWSAHAQDFIEVDVLKSLVDTIKNIHGKHAQYIDEMGRDRDTFDFTTGSYSRRDTGFVLLQTNSTEKYYKIDKSVQGDGYHIATTAGGLHIVTGTYLDSTFIKHGFIIAFNSSLIPIWAKKYDYKKFQVHTLLIEDTNFIIAGTFLESGHERAFMAWLRQSGGQFISGKKYSISGSLQAARLIKTSDTAYAMIGKANERMWFMKTDHSADPDWSRKFRGLYFGVNLHLSNAEGKALCEYKNQHYILAGECEFNTVNYRGLYLVNTWKNRDTSCFEDTIIVSSGSLTWDENYTDIDTSKIEMFNPEHSVKTLYTATYTEYPYFDSDCDYDVPIGHNTTGSYPGTEIPGCRCKLKQVTVKPLTNN